MIKESSSKLLNYVHLLMRDDEELGNFIADPITRSQNVHGLTKAERAVLRRTVAGLSNKSVNGYSMERQYGSYRRSLRLLQNVLHNVGSKMITDSQESEESGFTYSMLFYLPNVTADTDFTCKNNSYVQDNYGGPYAVSTISYTVTLDKDNATIKDVLEAVNIKRNSVTINGEPYISAFSFGIGSGGASLVTANLNDPCYSLDNTPPPDYVFWFYTINGTPTKGGTPKPGGTSGTLGQSYATKTLSPGDTVYWQLIAPDHKYGFQKCESHELNEYHSA